MNEKEAQDGRPDISLVVPVYNEEGNLAALTEEIARAMQGIGRSWELVLVDDGSTDSSLERIRELAAHASHIRYIALAANSGQSAAFAAGFREAHGDLVVTLDADLQNDPADIPAMLDRYGKDGVNMVVGRRAVRKDSLAKRLASRFGNAVRNIFTGDGVHDTGCSLKVMPRDMLLCLPSFTGMHRFFPALMRLQGAIIAEVAVNHRPRRAGHSKYGIWDRASRTAMDLLAVRWLQSRHFTLRIKERKT